MSKKIITLVIDGDILIYKAALAIQTDGFKVSHPDFVEYATSMLGVNKICKARNLLKTQVLIEDAKVLKNKHLTSAKYIIMKMVSNIKAGVNAEVLKLTSEPIEYKILMCVGGDTNFRKHLPLFHKYKDRKGDKPIALKEVKDLLVSMYTSDISIDIEADDRVSMFGFLGRDDMSYIAVTEDKDAKQTPMWLYIPRKNTLQFCGGLGEYSLEVKESTNKEGKIKRVYKMEGYGRRWLYYQVVCGDPVDTYNPFSSPRVSDYKFYNMFKDLKTDKEHWEKIYSLFHERYGNLTSYKDWEGTVHQGGAVDILQNYVDVVHMQRFDNDRLNVSEILTKYGIL